jgi:hypothetical protein
MVTDVSIAGLGHDAHRHLLSLSAPELKLRLSQKYLIEEFDVWI